MRETGLDIILGNLVRAVTHLESCREFAFLIPEVRVNLAYALPDAKCPQDVAAIEGRITHVHGWPRASGLPAFGASDHMARLLVQVRRYDPTLRAGINFAWSQELCDFLEKQGCDPVRIDRTLEPESVAKEDGQSMPWKIETLSKQRPTFPRLFFEGPAPGKEPLFVFLGESAFDVAVHVAELAREFSRHQGP